MWSELLQAHILLFSSFYSVAMYLRYVPGNEGKEPSSSSAFRIILSSKRLPAEKTSECCGGPLECQNAYQFVLNLPQPLRGAIVGGNVTFYGNSGLPPDRLPITWCYTTEKEGLIKISEELPWAFSETFREPTVSLNKSFFRHVKSGTVVTISIPGKQDFLKSPDIELLLIQEPAAAPKSDLCDPLVDCCLVSRTITDPRLVEPSGQLTYHFCDGPCRNQMHRPFQSALAAFKTFALSGIRPHGGPVQCAPTRRQPLKVKIKDSRLGPAYYTEINDDLECSCVN